VKAAVLGSPVSHSLSPVLHSAAYRALGLDNTYSAIEITTSELGRFLAGLDSEWMGVSLTMPLKEIAFEFTDECDETSSLTEAINTLVFGESMSAFNTDVLGIVDSLTENGLQRVSTAVIFGSGATARSALVALAQLGAKTIHCIARNQSDVQRMSELASKLEVELFSPNVEESAWLTSEVVVNTTPVGVLDELAKEVLAPAGVLLDVVYNPWPTQLASSWGVTGGTIVSGLSMLLHQAGHQVTLMTGHPAPVSEMRNALNLELINRGLSPI